MKVHFGVRTASIFAFFACSIVLYEVPLLWNEDFDDDNDDDNDNDKTSD